MPYTAPGVLRATLVVEAASREDAINAAVDVHARRFTNTAGNPSWRLHRHERTQIEYGEPLALPAEVAGRPYRAVAS